MNQELRIERWNLRAAARERQRHRLIERMHDHPYILQAAFIEAGGNWLKTAQILGIVHPLNWTDYEPPESPQDITLTIDQTRKLAAKLAPQLLDTDFRENRRC